MINNELVKVAQKILTASDLLRVQKGFNPTLLQVAKLSWSRVLVISLICWSFRQIGE